jgi:preprotein translocase subunit SecG
MFYQVVLGLHVAIALAIILLVFLQHGKGADAGAGFGGGASNTFFGSQGSGGVLYKATGCLAFAFCVTSVTLTYLVSHHDTGIRVEDTVLPTLPSAPGKSSR